MNSPAILSMILLTVCFAQAGAADLINARDFGASGSKFETMATTTAGGRETSLVKNNIIASGEAAGVKTVIEVGGHFVLTGNHISGFDEKDSSALSLASDALGRVARSIYRGNLFEKCSAVVPKEQPATWDAAKPEGNVLIECGERNAPNHTP